MAREVDIEQPESSRIPASSEMSYEEFLVYSHKNPHVEWVDGKVVSMAPISKEHSKTSRFLVMLITHFVEANQLGTVFFKPFQMKTGPDLPGR